LQARAVSLPEIDFSIQMGLDCHLIFLEVTDAFTQLLDFVAARGRFEDAGYWPNS